MTAVRRWLGVREGEGRLIGLVAAVFASVEAGRGFGEIGVDTLVIIRFGATSLPYLFILLGLASLVVALGYGAALGRLRRGPLLVGLLLGTAATLVLQRLALGIGQAAVPLLWVTTYAGGLLAVTMTWTVAGAAFDARQAKRLFPLCTSAAIVGSFLGTLAAGPVARLVGAESLVLLEAGLFAVAALLVDRIARPASGSRLALAPAGGSTRDELRAGLGYVAGSPLMRLVALAYVLFSVAAFSVSYPFLVAMSDAFPDEAALATALGLLSAATTAASFVVSLTIANRLLARFGVAAAAMTLPVVYVIGFAAWLVNFSVVTAAAFRFAQQVTQRGVSNAAWSALYNVVPGPRRAQVLAFIDGVPGQVGIVLSGVLLVVATRVLAPVQVFWLGLATGLALVVIVLAMRRRYADSLLRTLRSGLGEQILEGGRGLGDLAGNVRVVRDLTAALTATDPVVRRTAAELLGRVPAPDSIEALAGAVDDPDASVRLAALDSLARHGHGPVPAPEVIARIGGRLRDPEPAVRAAAIRAASALDPLTVGTSVEPLAADPSPAVRAALAVALVRCGEEDRPHLLLKALLESDAPEDRISGLNAVAAIGGHSPSPLLPALLHDPSDRVRAAAVDAAAAVAASGVDGAEWVDAVVRALGDDALAVRRTAVRALRNREEVTPAVLDRLAAGSPAVQLAALQALDGHGDAVRPQLLAWSSTQVSRATELRRQHAAVASAAGNAGDGSVTFLASLLARRRADIEERLLEALAVLGARDARGLIRRCLRSDDPDVRAQAVEALDTIGDRSLASGLVGLLEAAPDARAGRHDDTIRELTGDPDPWIRALAWRARAETLAHDWAELTRRAADDPDPTVRRALEGVAEGGAVPMPETVTIGDEIDRMLVLRRVPLFEGLGPEDLQRVAATAVERFYAAGEALVREGDVGDEMLVILDGSVRIVRDESGAERFIRRYGPGDHIGELAVLRARPRAATVIAEDPGVRALEIAGAALTAILRERPEAAMAMLATLAERVGTTG